MTRRTVHLPVAAQDGIDDYVDQAALAEECGYERAWLPETWGRDAATVLSAMAGGTESIGLGTSIVNTYSRSPALLAQTAATLQELSDGRFRLGIGPSGPAVIENWHGADFGNPLRRTREYLEIVKLALAGEEVAYDGDLFDLSGFRLRCDPPDPAPAVDAAGMGPKAVELCGRFADGWHALLFTPDAMRDRLEDFRRGAELGGRDPEDLRVTLSLTCCVAPDGERARDLAKRHLAFYVGAMGTFYRDSLARQGFEAEAETIARRYGDGDREGALAAIDESMVDSLLVAGTPERARAEVEKFEAVDGVDSVAVSFPRAADGETVARTIEALAPQ